MSMYVELLSGALDRWIADVGEEDLLAHVLACLLALPPAASHPDRSANTQLAAEVAYDRALYKLASNRGIEVAPYRFMQPQVERRRLEEELARKGIDLNSLIDQLRSLGR